MTWFGGAPHSIQDDYGNARAGIEVTAHLTQDDALARTNVLATRTVDAAGEWQTDLPVAELWLRLPDVKGQPRVRRVVGLVHPDEVSALDERVQSLENAPAPSADLDGGTL